MLSLWKLRVGAEAYYLGQVAQGLDDYYTGQGEMPGRWLGNAIGGLGLGGTVTGDDLRAVLAGLNPGTGQSPNGDRLRTWKGRVPGFDLTFSAPKSVSVLYALADPLVRGQIVEALDGAVDDALAWLEREACFVRRGSNNRASARGPSSEFGTRRLPGGGFLAAGFRHRTSRAGDPQLHTHVLVANLTRGPDGRWSALDAQAIYRSRRAAGAVYDAAVRHQLTARLGVDWLLTSRGDGEIAGIPQRVLKQFSKRRNEIEDELARLGQSGPVAAKQAALVTRTGKNELDGETLDARWHDEAAAVGYGPDDIDSLLARPAHATDDDGGRWLWSRSGRVPASTAGDQPVAIRTTDPDTGQLLERVTTIDDFGAHVAAALVEKDSTFTRHQVTMAIAGLLRHTVSTRASERLTDVVIAQRHFVPLPHRPEQSGGWEQRWTSRHLLDVETSLLALLQPEPGRCGALEEAAVDGALTTPGFSMLGSDQADMLRRVTTQGLPVEVVVGRAGTGKTYAMAAVRAIYTAAGYRLVGVAPSALAARGLGEGAGMPAFTIPRFLRRAAPDLTARHVIVVDEAGMVGTVDLHHILAAARTAGAKVILVGDHHQLPEIAAGGGFAAAAAAAAGYSAELTINRRQTERWEIDALDQLRHGHLPTAFRTYQEHGRVALHDRLEDVHAAAVGDWWHAYRHGRNALLLAGTRAEARALNRDGRACAAAAGLLHGPVLDVAGRHFQAGDRVILTRNAGVDPTRRQPRSCRVDNGMIGTIAALDPTTGTMTIQLTTGSTIVLDGAYVRDGHVDHGYAVTIHKAQGVTCDDVFVVGPRGLYRQAGYVALSRARHGAWLYATSHDAAAVGERHHSVGIRLPSEPDDDPGADLLDALEHSHAKVLASSIVPHLARVADVAASTALDQLHARHRYLKAVVRTLEAAGHRNPILEREQLATARAHRSFLHVGGRVRALDWDNVGTVTAIVDYTGTAYVHFKAPDGRQTTKCLPWWQIKPIDHPEPAELTADAADYFALHEQAIAEDVARWDKKLAAHGVQPNEPVVIPAAIEHRTRQVAHRLAGQQTDWLTWWLGERPVDPAGARVWDDEVAAVAAWRDTHHVHDDVSGYGPPPEAADLREEWRQHLERSHDVHRWLRAHRPGLDPVTVTDLTAVEIRDRLEELDAILAAAPPDQTRILDALHTGELTPADLDQAIGDAFATQDTRRQWILEHWPHVIEHVELTRLAAQLGPLDHWPLPLPAAAQHLHDQLATVSVATPEARSLDQLDRELADADPRTHAARLQGQLDALDQHLRDLHTDRVQLSEYPHRAADIDHHLAELRRRRRDLDQELNRYNAKAALWKTGHRPQHLVDAVTRRSHHLAHSAITGGEPWITEAVRAWHESHPDDTDIHRLHRVIVEIAAHRERSGHTGPDPLGPDHPLHDRWQGLHHDLATAPPAAPTVFPIGR
jgi:conjugative relaxase-like TrwC/TraI family protein